MQWAGVGMWMVLGLSACSPTKTEIGNLNVIPQPQEVRQDIQAHPFVINPQTGIVYPEGNEKLQRTAEFLASYIKEATELLSGQQLKPQGRTPSFWRLTVPLPTKRGINWR